MRAEAQEKPHSKAEHAGLRESDAERPAGPKVITAKTAGFCFGVKRAVSAVEELAEKGGGRIFTLGPIIHNEQVVQELEDKGVHAVDSIEELEQILDAAASGKGRSEAASQATVVIRSHGIARREEERLRDLGVQIVDATCPFVKKIHGIVAEASAEGRTVVIVGDADHPEVTGIRGWADGKVFVAASEEDLDVISANDLVTIVSQTTINDKKFNKIVEMIKKKCYDCRTLNTICNATQERQKEAEKIAANVDAMIVLGGKHSSNTQKLYSLCEAVCPHTFYAQTVSDLADYDFYGLLSVGITAGASTPTKIIEEVQTYVGREF